MFRRKMALSYCRAARKYLCRISPRQCAAARGSRRGQREAVPAALPFFRRNDTPSCLTSENSLRVSSFMQRRFPGGKAFSQVRVPQNANPKKKKKKKKKKR